MSMADGEVYSWENLPEAKIIGWNGGPPKDMPLEHVNVIFFFKAKESLQIIRLRILRRNHPGSSR